MYADIELAVPGSGRRCRGGLEHVVEREFAGPQVAEQGAAEVVVQGRVRQDPEPGGDRRGSRPSGSRRAAAP